MMTRWFNQIIPASKGILAVYVDGGNDPVEAWGIAKTGEILALVVNEANGNLIAAVDIHQFSRLEFSEDHWSSHSL